MSTDACASFGYGLKINKKLLNSTNEIEDLIRDDDELDFAFAGNEYSKDGLSVFIFIGKSIEQVYTHNGGAKQIIDSNIPSSKWDDKLKSWAKNNKILKPKIGWFLVVSV